MPPLAITIRPSRKAAARFVGDVRRELQRVLNHERAAGLNQSKIADALGVHRSVISRELAGRRDLSLGRIGELAWALGYKPAFTLEKVALPAGSNHLSPPTAPAMVISNSAGSNVLPLAMKSSVRVAAE